MAHRDRPNRAKERFADPLSRHRLHPDPAHRGHQVGRSRCPTSSGPSSGRRRRPETSSTRCIAATRSAPDVLGDRCRGRHRQIGTDDSERSPQLLIVDGQQRLTSLFAVLTGSEVLTKTFEEQAHPHRVPARRTRRSRSPTPRSNGPGVHPGHHRALGGRATRAHGARSSCSGSPRHATMELDDERSRTARGAHRPSPRPARLPVPGDRARRTRRRGAGRRDLRAHQLRGRPAQPGRLHPDADVGPLGEGPPRARGSSAAPPSIPRSTGPTPKNPFIDPSPDQLLRVGVAFAFRRARLQHVYNILRGKDLETGEVSAERREQQFAVLGGGAGAGARPDELARVPEVPAGSPGFRSRQDDHFRERAAVQLRAVADRPARLRPRPADAARVHRRWFFMAHTTGRYTSLARVAAGVRPRPHRGPAPGDGAAFVAELDRIVARQLHQRLLGDLPAQPARHVVAAFAGAVRLPRGAQPPRCRSAVQRHPGPGPAGSRRRCAALDRAPSPVPEEVPREDRASRRTRQVNAIANMAFLDWAENATISDSAPPSYWPVMTAGLDPERLKRQMHWHALPVGWEQLDYADVPGEAAQPDRRASSVKASPRCGAISDSASASHDRGPDRGRRVADRRVQVDGPVERAGKQADPKMEHVIVKTVCGFLNAEGGTLAHRRRRRRAP